MSAAQAAASFQTSLSRRSLYRQWGLTANGAQSLTTAQVAATILGSRTKAREIDIGRIHWGGR